MFTIALRSDFICFSDAQYNVLRHCSGREARVWFVFDGISCDERMASKSLKVLRSSMSLLKTNC